MEQTEAEFLASYDAGQFPRPSVTADIIVMTVNQEGQLMVLLVKRKGHPYKDQWAIPGGFLSAGTESTDQAAARELKEETGVENAYLKQLYTFSEPDRDPRTHVISVAYTALIPYSKLHFEAGDDATDAKLFTVTLEQDTLYLNSENKLAFTGTELAFDHAKILKTAIERLRGRISYEPDAFELLNDKQHFIIYELKIIFEAILGTKLDTSNFRKMFQRNYVATGFATPLLQTCKKQGRRAATLFRCNTTERSTS